MGMRHWLLGVGVVLTLMGCALLKQAHQDVQVGLSAPDASGQLPMAQAKELAAPLKDLPYGGVTYPVVAWVLGIGLAYLNGKRIRKGQSISTNNVTGWVGNVGVGKLNIEGIVQEAVTVIQGAFSIGPDGSSIQRAWKTGMAGLLVVLMFPPVQTLLAAHPREVTEALGALAAIGGLEKAVSKILPTQSPISTTLPV